MFNGRTKAITFSYDDGITQDKRFIKMLDKYGLKCTFNLNSNKFGQAGTLFIHGVTVAHCKPTVEEIADIYAGHEIAVHTLDHPRLPTLDDSEVIRQVEEDRKNLERICGYDVVGMAYPCGGVNNDDRVAAVLRDHTKIRYSRTITENHSFEVQDNLYRFNPTVYHMNFDRMFALADEFLALPEVTDRPQIFYIWGHTYEFDIPRIPSPWGPGLGWPQEEGVWTWRAERKQALLHSEGGAGQADAGWLRHSLVVGQPLHSRPGVCDFGVRSPSLTCR